MSARSRRPLSLTNLRALEAVARTLNFGVAAEELHVTQSAVSRQIKGLEDELGAQLFVRGTRHVQITPDGLTLLRAVEPLLAKLDTSVQNIRRARGRQRVSVTTFASFGSLWLLPRIEAFQREHPDIDIRVSAHDAIADLDDDPELDLALRYCSSAQAPAGGKHLFDETLTPAVSRSLWERIKAGDAPPLARPADLAQHTLLEEDDDRASTEFLSWRHWLACHQLPALEPRRWLSLNFTYQQVQAALAGHGVALARLPLVFEALQRGELVEPFGESGRIVSPFSYWMLVGSGSRLRSEVARFATWVENEAEATREAVGAAPMPC
ncbi:MAG TPA: LysR substrate-binding domain-containing protein [Caldimonas sp.]|jgi:LysR family glycine cleavage system transcriptional activator|nr:LysR substrate-binding domain-containing protein [Caldimonas sp.]HEX4233844.1 LysR substrate-binding domain-containing protein [Caldimonas sp.]